MAELPALQPFLNSTEHCSQDIDGVCVEDAGYSTGFVVYTHWHHCSESFINLPGINLLPQWLLAVMWGLFLLWAFFGVAVLSDAFVEGIEVITSQTRKYKRHDARGNVVWTEEPVWNWAVANITLLAVGSSSPEILLSLVEALLSLGKPAGEIGPSCIIGSGSYNLFGIIAICTISLPYGVFKKIEHTKVFWWTTTWSLWAHIWLWLVYKKISPNEIEVWEAWLTLGFTPIFVFTTWLVDTRGWNWFAQNKNAIVPDETPDEEEGEQQGNKDGGPDEKAVAMHPVIQNAAMHSILYYRQLAVQRMAGGGAAAVREARGPRLSATGEQPAEGGRLDLALVEHMDKTVTKVMLKSAELSVLESTGEAKVQVMRLHGDLNTRVLVHYTCRDDTAVTGLDYEPSEGTLVFNPGEVLHDISVKIVDDDMSEPDVQFTVAITGAEVEGGGEVQVLRRETNVTIVDDDDGGVLVFELPTWEAGVEDTHAQVTVVRRNGADGRVTVEYSTKDGSASAGTHFKKVEGTLVFNAGETRQNIHVPLLPTNAEQLVTGTLAFRLTLSNPMGGVVLGMRKDCRVVLVPGSKGHKGEVEGQAEEEEEFHLWTAWEEKFREAILPEYDPEEGGNVWVAMLLHYISITYKLIAACIPPAEWKNGYPCFIIALAVLGGLMAIVKEVAHMFGCAVGLSELMNGMSIVAMGTSLPDTFASRMAAMNDDNADAAVGNVMGSNCVNVFLGLGIPWVIVSLYYQVRNEPYNVTAGSLGFGIMIFSIFAVVAIVLLRVRRYQGGELGGEKQGQWVTFGLLFTLWLLFLTLTGLLDYQHIQSSGI